MWGWGNYVLALCEGFLAILRGSPTEIGNLVAVVPRSHNAKAAADRVEEAMRSAEREHLKSTQ